jgi:hypothetical protein
MEDPGGTGVAASGGEEVVTLEPEIERRSSQGWSLIVGAASAVALVLALVGWLRPMDVALVPSAVQVCVLGLVGFGGVIAAARLRKRSGPARAIVLLGGVGLALMVAVTSLVLVFGSGVTSETAVAVPGTDLTLVDVDRAGFLDSSDEVVLEGRLGPLPRRRTIIRLGYSCTATIRPVGPRTIEVTVEEMTEGCLSFGRGGTYHVVVGADGWSTTIERVDEP